jgi:trehalose 6-phosphate phosphatase
MPLGLYESATRVNNAALVEQVFDALRHGPAALITDIDGTISPIVRRPEEAYVLPLAQSALRRLRDCLAVVAVVTGRTVADAQRMVGLDGVTYVGNHGMEIWTGDRPSTLPEARPWISHMVTVLAALRERVGNDGILLENKGASASIHYRLAPDQEAARSAILDALAGIPQTRELRIEEGRRVVNLLPPLRVSKGSAVRWLVSEHHLNGVVYLGDDVTDAHAFKTLTAMRAEGGQHTLSVAVLAQETPGSVRQLADTAVGSVQEAAQLLDAIANRFEVRTPASSVVG